MEKEALNLFLKVSFCQGNRAEEAFQTEQQHVQSYAITQSRHR